MVYYGQIKVKHGSIKHLGWNKSDIAEICIQYQTWLALQGMSSMKKEWHCMMYIQHEKGLTLYKYVDESLDGI